MVNYILMQDGLIVAEVDCANEKEARKEIEHYAMMYSQDGEVVIIKKPSNKKGADC